MSSQETRIFDLVEQWEIARRKGREVSAEELCAKSPELLPEVNRRIKALKAMTWVGKPVENGTSTTQQKTTVVGRYQLIQKIGKGGFASVWKARDPELNRFVAIKVPHGKSFQSESFLEEARKAAKLRHPGIVSVFDIGRTKDRVFIVSELIEAGSLAERIKDAPPSIDESVRLVELIAEALFHAHKNGLIHRDIKPHNILLDEHGNPKITDFGIALSETQSAAEKSRSAGTLAYMSPEQAANRTHEIDARTDIYSLGVVLYQLITRRLPFIPNDSMELWGDIISHAPRIPRTIDHSIPIELERICLKAMAKKPSDRYSTAQDFAEDLRGLALQPQMTSRKYVGFALVLMVASFASIGIIWRMKDEASSTPVISSTKSTIVLTITPPEAKVLVAGNGVTLTGSGGQRTVAFDSPNGEYRLVATLDGFKTFETELKPELGTAKFAFVNLESIQPNVDTSPARQTSSVPTTLNTEPKLPTPPQQQVDHRNHQYKFTDEKEIRQDWDLRGRWQLEGGGLRLYGGKGEKEPGSNQGVALLTSLRTFKGDLSFEIDYSMSKNCWIIVHAWNQQFELKASGNTFVRLVRKGNTVTISNAGEDSSRLSVKLREENLESSTPISIHLDRRNLWRKEMELLIRRIGVESSNTP